MVRTLGIWLTIMVAAAAAGRCGEPEPALDPDRAAAERGRHALLIQGFLKPDWTESAYRAVGSQWPTPAPDPERDQARYAERFRERYGLHPAPFPNDGLPMGLRRGRNPDGGKSGLQIDCLVCHGGSIGGKSYVGLGNTQLDLRALLYDLTRADGRRLPLSTFVLNTSRGTNNAGQIAAFLISLRNPDLSIRRFPLPLGADLPECDTPAWWHLKRKRTMYYDGRTDARSVRTNMQFLLGEKTLEELKSLEPTFRDVRAFILSLEPPRYPFAVNAETSARGKEVFAANCARCHGTYGPGGRYPSKIIPIDVVGTDRARLLGLSDRLVAHFNSTWFAEPLPVQTERTGYQAPPLDGLWATAPYLHNGSVPTLHALLDSKTRPARFTRPRSTGFEHYDTHHVGWKYTEIGSEELARPRSAFEAGFYFDSSRRGLGNQGHTFGDHLTEAERMDLIEYLKTL